MYTQKDSTGNVYSTSHGGPAIGGETVTVHTSTGTKTGTMVGGNVNF